MPVHEPPSRRIRRWCFLPALIGWLLAAGTVQASAQSAPMLFQNQETKSDNLGPFKKWTGAVERMLAEKSQAQGACSDSQLNACNYARWMAFLETVRNKDKMTQLAAVNAYFNKTKYIEDQPNWNVEDYWATPLEFLQKAGDCEDYAIVKFMSLKMLGFDPGTLRIVAVQDLNLKVGHAILAVYLGDKIYILDNQIKDIIEDKKILHYQPVFSINETAWWRHKKV